MRTAFILCGVLLAVFTASCAEDNDRFEARTDTDRDYYSSVDGATVGDIEAENDAIYGRETRQLRDRTAGETGEVPPIYGREEGMIDEYRAEGYGTGAGIDRNQLQRTGVGVEGGTDTRSPATSPGDTPQPTASAETRDFVTQATSSGFFEVESSQLALERTNDQAERQFANMMIRDHAATNEELRAIAQRKGITISQRLQPEHQRMLDQLRSANANEFTSRYHDLQVQAHEEAIELFEEAAEDLDDPELRRFAERTLPTLREHLEHLERHSHNP